jgi:PAS domain S-box-containing protein
VVARLDGAFAEALTASVGEGVYAIDLNGRLTFMNPAASAIVGWQADELLGVEIHDLLHRLDKDGNVRPESECPLLAVAKTGVPVTFTDDVFVHRDGRLVPIACSSSPILSNGETIGAVVAFHDITERKESEERLRSEIELNEMLLGIASTLNEQRELATVVQLVTDAGRVACGAAFGAFVYNVTDQHGVPFTLYSPTDAEPMAELVSLVGSRTIRIDDASHTDGSVRSFLAVPVAEPNAEPIGHLLFGHERAGVFTREHERVVEAIAAHAAVAIRNARQLEREQHVSETLQRSMLPRSLPTVDGIDAVARYLPAQEGIEVGGDWYDVVPLPLGRVALVIGDVAGHNVRAASVMGEVRNAVRAYAVEGHSPSGIVERANRFLCAVAPDEMATCCYVELHPTEGTATIVLAGHPPPLIAGADGASYVQAEPGMPLGVDAGARFVETTVMLPPRGLIVMYTDGLVDQVHLPISEGMSRLRDVASTTMPDLDTLADSILVETAGVGTHDDAALLLVELTTDQHALDLDVGRWLPSDVGSAGAARRFISDVLAGWAIPDDAASVARLLASELVTNAVLHTAGEVEMRVRRDGSLVRVSVCDVSGERPVVLSSPDLDSTSGRGLLLVDELSSRWGVEDSGGGKVVWFELELS